MHAFHQGNLQRSISERLARVWKVIGLTSLGVMVLNSPGAVSLPVTAPSGFVSASVSVCVEMCSIELGYL
jgi:hypothetical protein